MSGENNRGFTSAIGLYIFIAVMVAVLVAATAPSYLKMPEVSFWRRILLFILSVPACTVGLFLGRVIRDAIAPAFVVAGSTGGLIKARLFWAFGPQAIGLAVGLALAGYVIELLPAPIVPIDETKIIGVYNGQNGLAAIWADKDSKGYCIKLGSSIICSEEGLDKSNTIEFETDINGKKAKNGIELEFEEKGRGISFTVDDYGVYSWSKPFKNWIMSINYKEGLFCGEKGIQSNSPKICITDQNAKKENWFTGNCGFNACPPVGTPITYTYDRYEIFDPDTMSFSDEEVLTSFQQAPPRSSIHPTDVILSPAPAPTNEVIPGLPTMPGAGNSRQPIENGGILPYPPTSTRGDYQGTHSK